MPSLLVGYRKRPIADIYGEVNEIINEYGHSDDYTSAGGNGDPEDATLGGDVRSGNKGTLMLDAA